MNTETVLCKVNKGIVYTTKKLRHALPRKSLLTIYKQDGSDAFVVCSK